jgi:hypothetical protein
MAGNLKPHVVPLEGDSIGGEECHLAKNFLTTRIPLGKLGVLPQACLSACALLPPCLVSGHNMPCSWSRRVEARPRVPGPPTQARVSPPLHLSSSRWINDVGTCF